MTKYIYIYMYVYIYIYLNIYIYINIFMYIDPQDLDGVYTVGVDSGFHPFFLMDDLIFGGAPSSGNHHIWNMNPMNDWAMFGVCL